MDYRIPEIQGETGMQRAISLMLKRYMESDEMSASADLVSVPGELALRFAWWLFDHPEELEAAAVEMEAAAQKRRVR